jgi:hypothetical protein
MSLRHSELDVCREHVRANSVSPVGTSCPCCHCSLVKNRGKIRHRNSWQPMRWSQHASKGSQGGGSVFDLLDLLLFPICCSCQSSHRVPSMFPKFPMRSPNCSQYSISFNPISFALSFTLFTYYLVVGDPQSSFFFLFFLPFVIGIFDWPIQLNKSSFDQSKNMYVAISSFGLLILANKSIGQRIWDIVRSYWEHVVNPLGTW